MLKFLPAGSEIPTRSWVVAVAIFLWGQGIYALLNPLFIAADRSAVVLRSNFLMTTSGISLGAALMLGGNARGMLFSISASAALCAIYLALIATKSLFIGEGKASLNLPSSPASAV
jgi:hypothetical protein